MGMRDSAAGQTAMEGVLLRVSVAAAALLAILAGAAQAAPSPTDPRSCAARFRAVQTMFSYDIDNPRSLATSKTYGERAKAVLVKAGLMAASATDIPKDVSDAGAAYTRGYMSDQIPEAQFLQDVRACDQLNGYPTLIS